LRIEEKSRQAATTTENKGRRACLSHGGKITLLSGIQPAEEFSTLVHEIGQLSGAEIYVAPPGSRVKTGCLA